MSGIKDSERIEALRKRLYERGAPPPDRDDTPLSDEEHEVATAWDIEKPARTPAPPPEDDTPQTPPVSSGTISMAPKKTKRKSYRVKLLLIGLACFVVSLLVSSGLLLFNGEGISGENISLTVEGPFTIGGGEVVPIDVDITNNNVAAIESVVLIVNYPDGALSATEERRELGNERLPLDAIAAGETVSIPLRAIVFGEENQTQSVDVKIQYRLANSNGLFERTADTYSFQISSAPVVLRTDALTQLSSGQETEVILTIASNAPTTLTDLLVQAEYPLGFDFIEATPSPTVGQNNWVIDELEPGEETEISIKGTVTGRATDRYAINYDIGVPSERDRTTMSSVLASAQTEFEIEEPFLGISLDMGAGSGDTRVIESNVDTSGSIVVRNTLDETIYDTIITATISGNALNELDIDGNLGFYDSNQGSIIWDSTRESDLEALQPGEDAQVRFSIEPIADLPTNPEINVSINVQSRRVAEVQVAESLTGTLERNLRISSAPVVRADVTHGLSEFASAGPIPPEVGEETTYTISMMVENAQNDISDAIVTATLPTYVSWQSQTAGTGDITYDQTRREVTWRAGKVAANSSVFGSFQVAITPSLSQRGNRPTLITGQQLRATDDFTGSTVRDSNGARSTEMSTETGFAAGNGVVQQ